MYEMDMDWFCNEVYELLKDNDLEYYYDSIDAVVSSPDNLQDFLGNLCFVEDYDFNQLAKAVEEVYALYNSPALVRYDASDDGYGVCLELSDNHTLWDIDTPDFDDEEYCFVVESARKQFEEVTGVECFLVGRSGRHVCVEDTFDNATRYFELCDVQRDLEESVINTFNKES